MNSLANWLLLAAIPAPNLFVLLYAARSQWRRTAAGRSLMYVFVVISLVLDQNTLSVFYGTDYPGREMIRRCLYGAIAVTFWWMLWTLLRIQSRGDERDSPLLVAMRHKGEDS